MRNPGVIIFSMLLLLVPRAVQCMRAKTPLGGVIQATDIVVTGTVVDSGRAQFTFHIADVLYGEITETELELPFPRENIAVDSYAAGEDLLLCLQRGADPIRGHSRTSDTVGIVGGGGEGAFDMHRGKISDGKIDVADFLDAINSRDTIRSATLKSITSLNVTQLNDIKAIKLEGLPELQGTYQRSLAHKSLVESAQTEVELAMWYLERKVAYPPHTTDDIKELLPNSYPPLKLNVSYNSDLTTTRTDDVHGIKLEFPWYVYKVAFSPDGAQVAFLAHSKYIDSNRASQGYITICRWPGLDAIIRLPVGSAHRLLAFSPDSKRIVTAVGPALLIMDTDSWTSRSVTAHSNIMCGDFSSSNSSFVVGCEDGSILNLKWDSTAFIGGYASHKARVTGVIFDAEGSQFLSSGYDGCLQIHDLGTKKILRNIKPAEGKFLIHSAKFTPTEHEIVACLGDGSGRILNAVTGVETTRVDKWAAMLPTHLAGSVLHNGSMAVGSATGGVTVVELTSGKEAENIGQGEKAARWGHRDYITDLTYSPDGKYLISTSSDHTVRFWRMKTD